MRSDRARRLEALERIGASTDEGHAATAAWLEPVHAECGHLVDLDLSAELRAAPFLHRASLIARWIDAVASADPAAGAEIERRLVSAAT